MNEDFPFRDDLYFIEEEHADVTPFNFPLQAGEVISIKVGEAYVFEVQIER